MQRIVKLSHRAFVFALTAVSLRAGAPLYAQNKPSWFLAPRTFLVFYDNRFAYATGWGGGFDFGREYCNDWKLGIGGAHHRAAQPLVFFGNAQEVKSDWWRAAVALQKHWRLHKKNRVAVFAEVEGGMLFIRQHALQISGGTFGVISLDDKSTIKFAPALGTGLRVRVSSRWAVLFSVKNHLVPWIERRVESATVKCAWKSYRQIGLGLSHSL